MGFFWVCSSRSEITYPVPEDLLSSRPNSAISKVVRKAGDQHCFRETHALCTVKVLTVLENVLHPNGDVLHLKGDVLHLNGDVLHPNGDALHLTGHVLHLIGDALHLNGDVLHLKGDFLHLKLMLSWHRNITFPNTSLNNPGADPQLQLCASKPSFVDVTAVMDYISNSKLLFTFKGFYWHKHIKERK